MAQPPRIAFAAGLLPATCLAAGFMAAVTVAAILAESRQPASTDAGRTAAVARPAHLEVDATYPVATWTVLVDGRPATAGASDTRRWRGDLPAGRECTVEAAPADPLAGGAAALRARLERAGQVRVLDAWGDGAAGLRIDLMAER